MSSAATDMARVGVQERQGSRRRKITDIATGVVLLVGVMAWMFTAPYTGNQGLSRTPAVFVGGTDTPTPGDFTPLNEARGNLLMKLAGFPPFVV